MMIKITLKNVLEKVSIKPFISRECHDDRLPRVCHESDLVEEAGEGIKRPL